MPTKIQVKPPINMTAFAIMAILTVACVLMGGYILQTRTLSAENTNGTEKQSGGWKRFVSTDKRVRFLYPPHFTVTEDNGEVKVFRKGDMPWDWNTFEIMSIGSTPTAASYEGKPVEENTKEMPPVTIDGKPYAFDKYMIGEGGPDGGGGVTTYVTRIAPGTYLSIMNSYMMATSMCVPGTAICEKSDYSVKTSEKDLTIARLVARTVSLK